MGDFKPQDNWVASIQRPTYIEDYYFYAATPHEASDYARRNGLGTAFRIKPEFKTDKVTIYPTESVKNPNRRFLGCTWYLLCTKIEEEGRVIYCLDSDLRSNNDYWLHRAIRVMRQLSEEDLSKLIYVMSGEIVYRREVGNPLTL